MTEISKNTDMPQCDKTTVMVSDCSHLWDKLTGIKEKGIPHLRIKGKWVRTCSKCGYKEYFSSGIFNGWYSTP